MLQSVGSQRVGHDWATELNCTGVETEAAGGHAVCEQQSQMNPEPTSSWDS